MAKEILAQALAEAEQIRARAEAEGFAVGQKNANSLAQAETAKVCSFMDSYDIAFG